MDKVKTSKLQILKRYFETLSMKDSDLVDSFYTHVIGLINQIKSHGETIEDKKFHLSKNKALPLLRSYLFSSYWISFLAQSFTSQVEYCTLQQHIYANIFSFLYFSSQQSQFQVPSKKPFVGTWADLGFNA